MRKAVGIQGLNRQAQNKQQFKKQGEQIVATQLQTIEQQMQVFKSKLEEFAIKYRDKINGNAEFRRQFQIMCTSIGVDPLASKKGFWGELLGVGDFYYELAVQIVEICLKTRNTNGGIIDIDQLCNHVQTIRHTIITIDDIERSVNHLKVLGNCFKITKIGTQKVVQSIPDELNDDHTLVLSFGQVNSIY
eukprot:TRINITY_DN5332_c0_g1_i3.p1 TRINITY_DN5332_c0_g1~~TRINITY_DN5332_c0_g1_i3.p1  ORF type:complete len:190 (-),score=80.02 TRINITY_DN5332_c0_g1_i3:37-606(-)